jgi:hypothetical protein
VDVVLIDAIDARQDGVYEARRSRVVVAERPDSLEDQRMEIFFDPSRVKDHLEIIGHAIP